MQDLRVKVVDSEFKENNSSGWQCDDYDRNVNLSSAKEPPKSLIRKTWGQIVKEKKVG